MSHDVVTSQRRSINFNTPSVREILPEYYLSSYPQLIKILEAYYQFLDSDQDHGFNHVIGGINVARDVEDSTIQQLDLLFKEIGSNTINSNYFRDPRYVARLIANFYRVKGSTYSTEGFFKTFFGIDAEITYPKQNVFVIDQSLIGPEDLALIQDGALYQTLSILIKSEIPISVWGDLYKLFVHPAGFYLGSQVVVTSSANMNIGFMPEVALSTFIAPSVATVGAISPTAASEVTLLGRIDNTSVFVRTSPDDTIEDVQNLTIGQLDNLYPTIESIITVTSPTFDADSDVVTAIDMSNQLETIDQNKYQWWDSDSDGYALQLP